MASTWVGAPQAASETAQKVIICQELELFLLVTENGLTRYIVAATITRESLYPDAIIQAQRAAMTVVLF